MAVLNERMAPNQRMYKQNPEYESNQSASMIPNAIDGNVVFSKASTPAVLIKQKNPNHIFINNSGSYWFNYETSASIGDTVHNGWEFGMRVNKDNGLPVRLDIQPCAWSGSADSVTGGAQQTGDVTFIYRGQ